MTERDLLDLAIEMHDAQRKFYKKRTKTNYREARRVEQRFIKARLQWGKGQMPFAFDPSTESQYRDQSARILSSLSNGASL
jgi:hypothetical protein